MLGFLVASENVAFSSALVLMILIGAVEAVGLGASAAQFDTDVDADGLGHDILGWLGVGRLPLLMLIVVALACFGVVGLALQQLAAGQFGALLPAWIAVPAAAVVSLPLTSVSARVVAGIMPRDETTAVSLDVLVGRRAHIVVGIATIGSPARARVTDMHGQTHYVLVEPETADERFSEGDEILLVRRDGGNFRAIAVSPRPLVDLGAL